MARADLNADELSYTGIPLAVDGNEKMQTDPHFKDYVLFYEYFHGDSGRGVGASHQTGWTALIARLLFPMENEEKWKFRN